MAELLTPGVFIQEVDFGPQPIEGVSTSTAGFVGETERGSTTGRPVLVTSFPDFQRKFGGFLPGKHLPLAIRGFFDNGGRRAFIMRVLPADAQAASLDVTQGYHVALLAAPQPATTAGNFILRVASVVGVNPADTLTIQPGGIGPLTVVSINSVSNSLEVSGADPNDMVLVKPATHAVEYQAETAATTTIQFTAKDKGDFGNRVSVLLTPVYLATATVTAIVTSPNVFSVNQIAPFAVGQTIEVEAAAGTRQYLKITAVLPAISQITVDNTVPPTAPSIGDTVRVTGWRLDVFLDQVAVETISGISSNNAAPDGVLALVNERSQWVQVVAPGDPTPPPDGPLIAIGPSGAASTTDNFPFFANGRGVLLEDGHDSVSDADIAAIDVIGSDLNGLRSGLKAIEAQDGISIIAAPGFTGEDFQLVVDELIAQSERRFDRFAVFESNDEEDIQDVLEFRGKFNSKFGAMYHPWLLVLDPATKTIVSQPPSGHVIGGYARTDNDRGVFKAPANITIRGIQDFTHVVPDGEQDLLNPAGVNVLRRFTGLGPVIWGARTISAESLWKYVPVRRLFIFIEQSLIRGTRFAVFEPNDQRLWARLRDGVTNFLTTQWRAGALFGAVPEEAFFVKVDETTTTQDDRDNGRVNIIVGIAPVKPAEFIVFQIGQAPNSVIISEQG
jgi:phage tail sheath protein FI